MKLEVRIGGRTRTVELEREACRAAPGRERLLVRLDGREVAADAVEVAAGAYSILLGGRSLEVRVQPAADGLEVHAGGEVFRAQVLDPRTWQAKRGGALEAEGRQQIVAPMPGKIVRVLVAAGDAVEAGQGLLVVEAMKMQNEVKSPKKGTIQKILVSEGAAVNAGDVLAIVE